MNIDNTLTIADLAPALERFWKLSGEKIDLIHAEYDPAQGSPVFTVAGKYTTRGWTEWTEGFHYGSGFLQFDATGDEHHAKKAMELTLSRMASHVSHIGVHDHGFNNLSTYGNWLRLQKAGKLPADQVDFCELAIKISGAVQASRWSPINGGGGYIYSFNGPHSLFVDTIRSCRIVMVAHALGHTLMGENDAPHSLLGRALQHIEATAKYAVFYGEGRDSYDEWGRTAHESVFNPNDGRFRCPNSQQGFSGFTTWTRGLAWAMVGFPEQLEFLKTLSDADLEPFGGRAKWEALMLKGARATCDWFIANTPTDGVPYWDGGAPGLAFMGDWRNRDSEPFNDHEPIDSSAAAIGAQGLIRLGRYLGTETEEGKRYYQAGLTSLRSLLTDTYLGVDPTHQGLLLHSVYHRPNGWDHVPEGQKVPCGEACMWGDYHLRELAVTAQQPDYTFYGCLS
ncbi:glycosyl hydrolase [Actomonas aquatica]|uniref:Glycosyl hydrolase n=1 Tax=Actomonas aquatica TaxID=2866162 RepID=A0ABZ1C886_9BACT|nr:glycosyl hydrolase [Opitutus sp. WL0086]WRQ87912.1 glycosyl hydrolase [Opitutus sp. WL0086]